MVKCNAKNCDNSKNYSWQDYCSYHEKCLSKLRDSYSSINNIKEIETFTTWFNGNCGWVVNYDSSSSSSYPYWVWIVIYEPAVKSMSENLSAIKHDNYSSLEEAKNKAQELKNKLQNDSWSNTPMLEVHPKVNSYEYFSNLITSPYVIKNNLPIRTETYTYREEYQTYQPPLSGGTYFYGGMYIGTHKVERTKKCYPNNPNEYLKPLDIVKVNERKEGFSYDHVGIYIENNSVCHFTKEHKEVRIHSWSTFLEGYHTGDGTITRYHPIIPFKHYEKIAEQIAWAYDTNFREYNLANRNCEHFANMCIYGINYSEQIEDKKDLVIAKNVAKSVGLNFLFPPLLAFNNYDINNDKGSTIKLTNEMRETEDKFGWRTNDWSKWIESQARQEVPPKEYCRIM